MQATLRSIFSLQSLNFITILTVSENKETTKHGQKCQMMWDWKQGCQNKKAKGDVVEKKVAETFYCLECLELALQGKVTERFSCLCKQEDIKLPT